MYNFVASSIARLTRERENSNQDFFRYKKLGNLYVAVVTDGVSHAPYGREGAQIAANSFINYVEKSVLSNPSQEIEILISNAIHYANEKIIKKYASGAAMTTIVAMVISVKDNSFVIGNVGDSEAYHFHQNGYDICTIKDIRAVARIVNGKTVIKDGMPVINSALSAALGTDVNLNPNIKKKSYKEGDIITISTDGIDSLCMEELIENYLFLDQKGIDDLVSMCAERSDDDSTIVMIILGERQVVKELKEKVKAYQFLSNDEKEDLLKKIRPYSDKLYEELLCCYRYEDKEEYQIEIFQYIYNKLNQKQLIVLADEAAKSNKRILLKNIIDKLHRF